MEKVKFSNTNYGYFNKNVDAKSSKSHTINKKFFYIPLSEKKENEMVIRNACAICAIEGAIITKDTLKTCRDVLYGKLKTDEEIMERVLSIHGYSKHKL